MSLSAFGANGVRFEIDRVRHRLALPPKAKALTKDAPLALSDLIERVNNLAHRASTLQGVGHTNNQHAFAEGKSDLVRSAHRLADDIRQRGIATAQ